jgi:hypothetical protein
MLPRTKAEADAQLAATKHLENDLSRAIGKMAGLSEIVAGKPSVSIVRRKPNRKTVRDGIRGSVPAGKLRGARISLRDVTKDNSPIGGFTEYGKGGSVVKIGAPVSDTSFGVTVRGHETRHATRHTPRRKKPLTENEALACQIVDDVNIESTTLPNVKGIRAYKRAHLATAFDGVRTIARNVRAVKSGKTPDSIALRNGNLLNAVRTIGMLRAYGTNTLDELGARHRGYSKIRAALGDRMTKAAGQVASLAKMRSKRARAISMLVALMETEPDPDLPEREGDKVDGDIIPPVEEGDALDGKMELLDLKPKDVYCAKEKRITRRHAPNGVIINPNRFVAAIVSGESNGLFARRVRQKSGGCVVIDASGSMGATQRNLAAVCALVPMATVGYYSGGNHASGILAIFADKGKRYNGELPIDTLRGGNAVDLPAIRWLLSHPKPWVLVSDLQFCGGVMGSEAVAHAIVERLVSRGQLKVYRSLDEAYEAFGGKGPLKN